jgi:hypothetical protein
LIPRLQFHEKRYGRMKLEKSNKLDQEFASEEIEDEAMRKVGGKKKARLRTRGLIRQASTKNLPDTS